MNKEKVVIEKALLVVEKCSTKNGLFASGMPDGYTSVWARDSMITLMGASLFGGKKVKEVFGKSLETLAKHQSRLGQVPNCVDLFDPKRKKQVTYATIDSTLWFLIGEYFYSKIYKDESFMKKHSKNIRRAFLWLEYQDSGEDLLPEQQPTTDWQDCFPHKYGHTINTIALYYCALKCHGKKSLAEKIKKIVNAPMEENLAMFNYEKGYYYPWIWKGHDGIREEGKYFDSLGNILAAAFGLADKKKAKAILDYIEQKGINRPFPVVSLYPPIKPGDEEWKPYFEKSLAGTPWWYLNGGIWPFIGGFYVAALAAAGQLGKAKSELALLEEANHLGNKFEWEFNEWINPLTGKPGGGEYQAWSAGGYLFARAAVEKKRIPIIWRAIK